MHTGMTRHLRVSFKYSTQTPFSPSRHSLAASLFDLMLSRRASARLMTAPLLGVGHPHLVGHHRLEAA